MQKNIIFLVSQLPGRVGGQADWAKSPSFAEEKKLSGRPPLAQRPNYPTIIFNTLLPETYLIHNLTPWTKLFYFILLVLCHRTFFIVGKIWKIGKCWIWGKILDLGKNFEMENFGCLGRIWIWSFSKLLNCEFFTKTHFAILPPSLKSRRTIQQEKMAKNLFSGATFIGTL